MSVADLQLFVVLTREKILAGPKGEKKNWGSLHRPTLEWLRPPLSWPIKSLPTDVRSGQNSSTNKMDVCQLVLRQSSLAVLRNLIRQRACPIKSCLQNQVDPGEQGVAHGASVQQLVLGSRVTDTHAPGVFIHRSKKLPRTSCKAFLRQNQPATFTWAEHHVAAGPLFFEEKKNKSYSSVFLKRAKGSEVSNPQNYFSHSNAKPATGKVKRISTPVSDRLCGFHGLRFKNLSFTSVSALQNCLHLSVSSGWCTEKHLHQFLLTSLDFTGSPLLCCTVATDSPNTRHPHPQPPSRTPLDGRCCCKVNRWSEWSLPSATCSY